eukprot:1963212-Pyramimonas_sp.AAC.1
MAALKKQLQPGPKWQQRAKQEDHIRQLAEQVRQLTAKSQPRQADPQQRDAGPAEVRGPFQ